MNELISFLDGQRDACLYHASASPKRHAWKWEQKAERYRQAAQEIARAEMLRGEIDAFLTWWSSDHTADPMSALQRLIAIRDAARAQLVEVSACCSPTSESLSDANAPTSLSSDVSASPRPAGGWQTMESAPKDGTRIDVWHRGQRVCGVHWQAEWREWSTSSGRIMYDVTHWMPLPSPPRAERTTQ